MKQWKDQIPTMSSASVILKHRQKLWEEVRDHPEYDAPKVQRILEQLDKLNRALKKKCMTPKQVRELLKQIKPGRTHKSIAKTNKISRRKLRYIKQRNPSPPKPPR